MDFKSAPQVIEGHLHKTWDPTTVRHMRLHSEIYAVCAHLASCRVRLFELLINRFSSLVSDVRIPTALLSQSTLICDAYRAAETWHADVAKHSRPDWQAFGLYGFRPGSKCQDGSAAASTKRGLGLLGLRSGSRRNSTDDPNENDATYMDTVKKNYARAVLQAQALADCTGLPAGRKFSMSSEAFLKWSLWRLNVSVALESSWCIANA